MKERPILFSGPMVRAILDGTKTQTRRVLRKQFCHDAEVEEMGATNERGHQIAGHSGNWWDATRGDPDAAARCPYGQPGDRLWVRETFAKIDGQTQPWIETDYRATYTHGDRLGDSLGIKKRWTPAIHMPRAASRITLEVTGVRVERLNDISRGDAMAEGCPFPNMAKGDDPRQWYADLWDQINGPGAHAMNPLVWVVEFRRLP